MLTFEQKSYRAKIFKIAGFALMSPFGSLAIDMFRSGFINLKPNIIIAFLISFLLAFLGVILIQRGFEAIEKD